MLNPYFTQGTTSEQDLVQDLVDEQIRMYGIDVYYIPRSYVTKAKIIKEIIQSEFNNAYAIEAYVSTYNGYDGVGTLLSKFGIQEQDDLTIVISQRRYRNYLEPLVASGTNIELSSRPKEGDLIYFPLGDRIFEIKYVEHESPFFQLKKNYVYELRCELYRLAASDVFDTDIADIDNNLIGEGYIQTLSMVGVGSTATAITGIVNGGVRFVNITNRGTGYTTSPNVSFSLPPQGGVQATGIASMISGIVDFCDTNKESFRVQSVLITNPGAGYTVPPLVSFTGGGGVGAAGTAIIGDGIVGVVTVTSGGSGYIDAPSVTFSAPLDVINGITAEGIVNINSSGIVTSVYMINAGLAYTQTPTVTIGNPPVLIGTGDYLFNEVVVGSSSSVTARVRSWNSTTNILQVATISGRFITGENIIGQESGASYAVKSINTDNIEDKFASNDDIQLEANELLDFTETNPFGTP
jgi:hypothetical protein